ncbi:MAG TPA: cbb3-type cytochrome c oxidase subunit 3 [Phycisphaerales bacterium]|nr:cbb3-type cytochrome c oxidase subunit 3 [Phycisphaerales bacterium]
MRMSDIVSSLGLSIYPIVGMVLFLGVFVGVIVRIASRRRLAELDRAAWLPLADDAGPPAHPAARTTPSEPTP